MNDGTGACEYSDHNPLYVRFAYKFTTKLNSKESKDEDGDGEEETSDDTRKQESLAGEEYELERRVNERKQLIQQRKDFKQQDVNSMLSLGTYAFTGVTSAMFGVILTLIFNPVI